jgi:uncharacterized protein (DUF2267 family)
MEYAEFIHSVQERAGMTFPEEAASAVEAVLETLGERLERTERDNLATQLPKELARLLEKRGETQRYDLEEFYNRVGARAEVRHRRAVELAHCVASVLKEAVSPGELRDVLEQLPYEYGQVFRGAG